MTRFWSRRIFLAATSGTALSLGLVPATHLTPEAAAAGDTFRTESGDEFSALRAKWRTLILGEGFSPTAEPFKSRLTGLGTTAAQLRSSMAPATGCVSDPMRMQTSLTLTWNRAVASVTSKPVTVTGVTTGASLRLTFGDLSGTTGATQKVTVKLG